MPNGMGGNGGGAIGRHTTITIGLMVILGTVLVALATDRAEVKADVRRNTAEIIEMKKDLKRILAVLVDNRCPPCDDDDGGE